MGSLSFKGVSKSLAIVAIVAIVVGVAAFFGGMTIGRSSLPQQAAQVITVTIPQRVTITQTIVQTATIAPTEVQTPAPAQVPDKILVGVAIALSGAQADAGKRQFLGIMAAVKWVNEVYGGVKLYGKRIPLELKYYDDESKKDLVISYVERLITVDKVNFLISPYSSPLAFAAAPVAEKYRVLMVNSGGASDYINEQGFKYVASVLTPASKYLWPALDALKQINPGARIAILYKDDEFNRASGQGASARAKELGLQVVYEKIYPADIKDFTPIITELAGTKADSLVVSAHYADGQLLTKQLADLGLDFKFIAINVAPCIQSYYDTLKILAEGILCPSQWEPGVKYTPDLARGMGLEWFGPTTEEFLKLFREVAKDPGLLPSYHSAIGAAAVLMLAKAIEAAQSLDSAKVREAISKLNIMTFYGLSRPDPVTGKDTAHEMVLGQWQKGRFVVVWPPSVAEAKLYYPLPTWEEKRAGKTAG
jgi:branched-chain amino acid transport system substrate-binding protein